MSGSCQTERKYTTRASNPTRDDGLSPARGPSTHQQYTETMGSLQLDQSQTNGSDRKRQSSSGATPAQGSRHDHGLGTRAPPSEATPQALTSSLLLPARPPERAIVIQRNVSGALFR